MSQYVQRSWSINNGFPGGPVSSITQSTDGYLWIGTEKGLVRFDGLSFYTLPVTSKTGISLEHVLGLASDPDGGLWLRLPDPTIVRYRDGAFSPQRMNPNHDPLVSVMVPGRGASSLFFASRLDGLFTWKRNRFESVLTKTSIPGRSIVSIAEAANGDIWLGTIEAGLLRVHDKTVESPQGLANQRVNCLLAGLKDEIYVGTNQGLARWDGARMTTAGLPDALRGVPILSLAQDRDANIWIGTERGLVRLNAKGVSAFEEAGSGKAVTALFEDREGDLWAARPGELECIRESAFVTYQSRDRNQREHGGPVHADARGRVWAAPSSGGLYAIDDGTVKEVPIPILGRDEVYTIDGDGDDLWLGAKSKGLIHLVRRGESYLPVNTPPETHRYAVYAVHASSDGTIWSGTLTAGVMRLKDGHVTTYSAGSNLPSNTILSIAEGRDGTMWFGTPSGLTSLVHENWRTYGQADGLPSENVATIFEDDSHVLWLGTLGGLCYIRSGKVSTPAKLPTPLLGHILGITQDRFGSLWIATQENIVRVDRAKLLSGSLGDGDIREFGVSDGLLDARGIRREHVISTAPSGRIWISRNQGVGELDPARLQKNTVRSIAHIQRLLVDGDPQDLHGPLRLPWNAKRIAVEYAGLNLSFPEQIRFRYRLDGYEQNWSAPVSTRSAEYTNLDPGPYRLLVSVSNADQLWDDNAAGLAFYVEPAVWQTWWFRAAVGLLLASMIAVFYTLRLRQITENASVLFEARLAERTRIARELHDTLLQSFHGLMLRFQAAQNLLPHKPAQAQQSLATAIDQAAKAITEGRDAVQELRTTDPGVPDLVATLQAMGQNFSNPGEGQKAPDFRVLLEGTPRQLRPEFQQDLHRIAREAVTNAFRHANATHIEVDLRYAPRMLRLRVRDNGKGIDASVLNAGGRQGHWGLTGMEERARAIRTQLEIWSESNRGTEIELTAPASIAYVTAARTLWSKFRKGGLSSP